MNLFLKLFINMDKAHICTLGNLTFYGSCLRQKLAKNLFYLTKNKNINKLILNHTYLLYQSIFSIIRYMPNFGQCNSTIYLNVLIIC